MINHKARAAAFSVASLGFLLDFLQRALPAIQSHYPDVKWIGPLTSLIGIAWAAIQHSMDANK